MKKELYLFLVWVILCCSACVKEPEAEHIYERTLLVYMAGDNSLSSFVDENTLSIEKGVKRCPKNSTRVVVLYDNGSSKTTLMEVTSNGRKVMKDYGVNLNTGDRETLKSVLNDVKEIFQTPYYGLILWSHGSGWLPPTKTNSPTNAYVPKQLAFGQDSPTGSWLSTEDLVYALEDDGYDFVLFDACYMASVELLYALRHKTKYFVVSPTEIMADGFPYEKLVPLMNYSPASREKALRELCKAYFEFYSTSSYPYASISLIDSEGLEGLAESIRGAGLTVEEVSEASVQQFHRQSDNPCYDFTDAYSKASGGAKPWEAALSKVVLELFYTPYFGFLPIKICSGLSTYIPQSNMPSVNEAYFQTEWFKTTVLQQ